MEKWLELATLLSSSYPEAELLLIGGEADHAQLTVFSNQRPSRRLHFARDLPLPHLAAVLERCRLFLGHEQRYLPTWPPPWGLPSSLLLFGPDPIPTSGPAAAANPNVDVLNASAKGLENLTVDEVYAAATRLIDSKE